MSAAEKEAMEFVVETEWDDKRPPLGFHHAWQVGDKSERQAGHVLLLLLLMSPVPLCYCE